MFLEITVSNLLIIILFFLVCLIYLHYLKVSGIAHIRHQCQMTREQLNKIRFSTDVLDHEYFQLKQRLSLPLSDDNDDMKQRLTAIENSQQQSLIDQQRIQTLEYLNRQLKNELNTSKLINEGLRRRISSTSSQNTSVSKIRTHRSFSSSQIRFPSPVGFKQPPWPFPYFPPWIRPRLPSVSENHSLEIINSPQPYSSPGGFPFSSGDYL